MYITYFNDTDTLYIQFNDKIISTTSDLDENTLIERDEQGSLVSITVEHASDNTKVNELLYEQRQNSSVAERV